MLSLLSYYIRIPLNFFFVLKRQCFAAIYICDDMDIITRCYLTFSIHYMYIHLNADIFH